MVTVESQLASLEARFAALEVKYNDLLSQKPLTPPDIQKVGVITQDAKVLASLKVVPDETDHEHSHQR